MKKMILVFVMCLQSMALAQTVSEAALSSQAPPQNIQKLEIDVIDQGFTSSSKVVITADEIKKSQINNLAVLLSTKANITISQSSFQPNSIFIRGGDSSHVLFLIDGIPFYDASSIQRTISLNGLNLRNVKRIEVIKGSQSVLYGGQAFSGIVKIETFPKELITQGDIVVQGGQYFGEASVSSQYKLNDGSAIATSLKYADIYNKSPVKDSTKLYPQKISSVDLAYIKKLNESGLELITKAQYSNDENEIATSNFVTYQSVDTDGFDFNSKAIAGSFVLRDEDAFSFSGSYQKTDKILFQEGVSDRDFTGELVSLRGDYYILNTQKNSSLIGVSYIKESIIYLEDKLLKSDHSTEYEGIYTKNNYDINEDIEIEAGYRKEFVKFNDISDTFQVGLNIFEILKLEYSTGFKTPSLSQLYASYGNPNLKSEKVKTYSVTLEKQVNLNFLISLTAFDTRFSNLITAVGPSNNLTYVNLDETETRGVEGYTGVNFPDSNLDVQLSLAYQEPKDLSTGKWLAKRPLKVASLRINLGLNDQTDIGFDIVYTGSRIDRAGARMPTLDSYILVNSTLNVQLDSELSAFVRAENVTDTAYESSVGYYIDGLVARVGLNYRF